MSLVNETLAGACEGAGRAISKKRKSEADRSAKWVIQFGVGHGP
jgi:hypothetical protein